MRYLGTEHLKEQGGLLFAISIEGALIENTYSYI